MSEVPSKLVLEWNKFRCQITGERKGVGNVFHNPINHPGSSIVDSIPNRFAVRRTLPRTKAFWGRLGPSQCVRNFTTRSPTGTPRRAMTPGEGSLRPRVARAQKIIRLHPFLCSGSKGSARVPFHFLMGPLRARKTIWLSLPPLHLNYTVTL
ncbi:MAG: hypothetical protein H7Y39_15390 [Nitrospiraceae bacterium]|nr:hypothetical protein [Nitrospiraceae bacterium]